MSLHIEPFVVNDSNIDGLKIISAKMSTDDRGTVRELFRGSIYSEVLPETVTGWKQINLTKTKKGAVRGLHGEAMSKLVTVAYGAVFGAYVDTRPDSKTFGAVQTVHITPGVQVFVPQGVRSGCRCRIQSEVRIGIRRGLRAARGSCLLRGAGLAYPDTEYLHSDE